MSSSARKLVGAGMPTLQATLAGNTVATVAGVGTAQSGAGILKWNINLLTTSGGATAFVPSDIWAIGDQLTVFNTSATAALFYPPVGGAIDGGSTDASVSLAQNEGRTFTRVTSTSWRSGESVLALTTLDVSGNGTIGGTLGVTGAVTLGSTQAVAGNSFLRGRNVVAQAAPAAKTVTAGITAAELVAGLITTTGVTAPSLHQLPTGTEIDAAIPGIATGDSFDFSVINTGTGASDDATITVNTDVTIVGNPTMGALTDATIISGSGRFRARRSAANTYIIYRIS